jgi:hypothetical protein
MAWPLSANAFRDKKTSAKSLAMAWPPAPANASLVTKWLSPVKPDAKSPAKRPRHGEALPTRNLPQTPLSRQNEHTPLHILPMALAIKTRHRRNNKLAVGKVAVGTATHGHTAPTHILPGCRSGYKARRYSDTYGIAI